MKDFRTVFKQLANDKKLTASDMYFYSILRAAGIKSEITYDDRVRAAFGMAKAAFTPATNVTKLKCNYKYSPYFAVWKASGAYLFHNSNLSSCIETKEEEQFLAKLNDDVREMFQSLEQSMENADYYFVVVRTNLPRIQQAVQSNHASMQLGALVGSSAAGTNLVLCGVDGVPELNCLMDKVASKGITVTPVYEPDLHNSLTAFAAGPLKKSEKTFLEKVQLLRL